MKIGTPLPRPLRHAPHRIRRLRIPRRPLRRPLHQPDQKRHPQSRQHNFRTIPHRFRDLLRHHQPKPHNRPPNRRLACSNHQENHRRARSSVYDAPHPRDHLQGNNLLDRTHGSYLRRGITCCSFWRNNDNTPLQRDAPPAPPQPGRLRRPRPRRVPSPSIFRHHRRRDPPPSHQHQNSLQRAPRRLYPGD